MISGKGGGGEDKVITDGPFCVISGKGGSTKKDKVVIDIDDGPFCVISGKGGGSKKDKVVIDIDDGPFCVISGKGGGSKKDKVTLAKLQSQLTQQDRRKVTTLSVQDLLPADKAKVATKMASELEQPL